MAVAQLQDVISETKIDGGPYKSSKDEEEVHVPSGTITRSQAKAFKEKLNTFIQDMLKNSNYIKEEEQICIMSIQVNKDEEMSSFGENATTLRCTPDAQRVVATKFSSGNFRTYTTRCGDQNRPGGSSHFYTTCAPGAHHVVVPENMAGGLRNCQRWDLTT